MKKYICLLLLSLLNIFPLLSHGGWVITFITKTPDGKEKEELLYVQNNIMKSKSDYTFIYNMNTSEMTMMNDSAKVYWKGTTKDYKNGIVEAMKLKIAEELKSLPENQRPYAERMYNDALDKFISNQGVDTVQVVTEVKKTEEKILVAGYETEKFEVWVNNIKKMDMWISEKINISKDFNYTAYVQFMKELTNSRSDLAFQTSPEYIGLLNKGFCLKSYDGVFELYKEAVKVEKKTIGHEEFEVPSDYKLISIGDILQEQNKSR